MSETCSDCGNEYDNLKGLKAHQWQTDCGGSREYTEESVLRELYHDKGMSLQEIADKYDVDHKTIDQWMERHGIEKRAHREAMLLGPASFTFVRGYPVVRTEHDGETYHEYVHRLAAVAWFGYDAVAGNVVHHKHGAKCHNSESNLEVLTEADHKGIHAKERQPELGRMGAEARWGGD